MDGDPRSRNGLSTRNENEMVKRFDVVDIFLVGTSMMMFPKDDSLGASAKEIINCRCSVKYIGSRNNAANKASYFGTSTTELSSKNDSVRRKFSDTTSVSALRGQFGADVEELQIVTIDDIEYRVDGKNVIFNPSRDEKRIATLLSIALHERVQIVPRVLNPQGIKTPDYMINGEKYDLKTITGTSKNVLYNAVKNKKRQASNFVFDISGSGLGVEDLQKQAERLFDSDHTRFIDRIVLVKDDEIIRILKRN